MEWLELFCGSYIRSGKELARTWFIITAALPSKEVSVRKEPYLSARGSKTADALNSGSACGVWRGEAVRAASRTCRLCGVLRLLLIGEHKPHHTVNHGDN